MNDLRAAAADADWQYRARERHAERGTMPPLYREAAWPADAPGRVASRHGLTYFDAEWLELSLRERTSLAMENGAPWRRTVIVDRARRALAGESYRR